MYKILLALWNLFISDGWGPAPSTSLLCFRYYIFVDDFTRFTLMFLLKQKTEVCECFIILNPWLKINFLLNFKLLEMMEEEYINNAFKNFCSIYGVLHQVSCPHVT